MDPVLVVRTFLGDVATDGQVSRIEDLVSPEFEGLFPTICPEVVRGYQGYLQIADVTRAVWPDLSAELKAIAIGSDDRVISIIRANGTHSLEWCGIAPTHRKMEWSVMHLTDVVDGKIIRDEVLIDRLEIFTQMGVECPPRIVHAPDGLVAKLAELDADGGSRAQG